MGGCIEMWKPIGAMVIVEFSFAVVNILLKKALSGGMNHVVIIVYRQTVSTVFLIPLVFFWERSSWNKLTARLIGQMFLCALLGLTLTQYLFLVGLDYTTATFACAFINSVPVFTFLLALPLRMEKVNLKTNSGQAKVIGAVTCGAGALILSLYKGMRLISSGAGAGVPSHERPRGFGLGSAFLCAGSLAWSSWFLIQSRIGRSFPYRYSSTSIMSLFSAVQSAALCLLTDRNMAKWIVRGQLQILSVAFAGIVGSGLCYAVMSWCVKKRGPVFTSAFSPLIQIFAAIFDVLLLHEDIFLGSVLGSVVVIVGMYVLLWGKSKGEEICDGLPKRAADNGPDSEIPS